MRRAGAVEATDARLRALPPCTGRRSAGFDMIGVRLGALSQFGSGPKDVPRRGCSAPLEFHCRASRGLSNRRGGQILGAVGLTEAWIFEGIEPSGRVDDRIVREAKVMSDKPRRGSAPSPAGSRRRNSRSTSITRCGRSSRFTPRIPNDAFTAKILGTERAGSGVVIRESGLVLTIGYLVTEAENVCWQPRASESCPPIRSRSIRRAGFALVQALGALDRQRSSSASARGRRNRGTGHRWRAAAGSAQAVRARIVGKEEFAGYWEYHSRRGTVHGAGTSAVGRRRADRRRTAR